MTFGTRKSIVWKSWRRRKLDIDLTYKVFQMKGAELIRTVSSSTPFESYGSNESNSQITSIVNIMLLNRAQRLQ